MGTKRKFHKSILTILVIAALWIVFCLMFQLWLGLLSLVLMAGPGIVMAIDGRIRWGSFDWLLYHD